ncbi:immunoglobulin E-set [Xylariaceae sp. FL1019]|nr:immunoglobulin E-set [Xylariaceae sp. FL1019]
MSTNASTRQGDTSQPQSDRKGGDRPLSTCTLATGDLVASWLREQERADASTPPSNPIANVAAAFPPAIHGICRPATPTPYLSEHLHSKPLPKTPKTPGTARRLLSNLNLRSAVTNHTGTQRSSSPVSVTTSSSGLDPFMTCKGNPAFMNTPEEEKSTTAAKDTIPTSNQTSNQSPSQAAHQEEGDDEDDDTMEDIIAYLKKTRISTVNKKDVKKIDITKQNAPKNEITNQTVEKSVDAKKSGTDSNDESLQRYKQSLGLGGGKDLSDPSDPRVAIIQSLTMESPGRSPVTIDLSQPGSESTLKDKPFKIKEGAKFTMVASFRVQHEILSGLQYVQVVKRKGIKVSKDSEMLGSYAPNTDKQPTYTKRFQEEDAPSGMLARGHYNAISSFVDDDKKNHLQFEWSFDIAKDW